MVGTAGGRRAILALALCAAGYLAVSLLRLGRDPADSGGFLGGDEASPEEQSSAQLAGDPERELARIAATVVLEPQAFASVRLELVDVDRAAASGVRARLEGKQEGGASFEATKESDSLGKVEFEDVADGCPLKLALGGQQGWVSQELSLAALSAGEARDLGQCVLQRGLTITGFVVEESGAMVADSKITLFHPVSSLERRMNVGLAEPVTSATQTTRVDEQGRFRFEGVAAGTYVLEASAPGYLVGRIEPLRVPDGADHELELQLERGVVAHGRVVDENGSPVTDARVARIASSMALSAKTRQEIAEQDGVAVDSDGRFELGGLRAEENAFLFALAPQRVVRVVPLAVSGDEVTCVLPAAHVLKAKILDQAQRPVPESFARIEPLRIGRSGEDSSQLIFDREAHTGEHGTLELGGLPEGEYRLVVSSAAGHLERELTIPCPDLEVSLAEAEALTVRVTDAAQRPAAGLRVELALPTVNESAAPSGDRILRAGTDEDGRAVFRDLLRGLWNVRVLRDQATLVEETLEITSLPAEVQYTALDPGSLIVHVVDGSKRPVQGVPVRLTREVRPAGRRAAVLGGQDKVTDAFGRVAWIGVASGDYLVSYEPRDLGRLLGSGVRNRSRGSSALVSVVPGASLAATLTLAEPTLRVQVSRRGLPVARALVSYCTAEETPDLLTAMAIGVPVSTSTDDAGWTTLVLPEPGEYIVKVRPSVLSPLTSRTQRVGKGTETLIVELEGGVVSGTCTSKSGTPVKRAQVNLIPAPEGGDKGTLLVSLNSPVAFPDDSPGRAKRVHLGETTAFTDLFGGFRFDDVPSGNYHLEVLHPSFATWSSNPFPVGKDSAVELGELSLQPTCSLKGRIDYGPWAESAKKNPVVVRLLTKDQESVAIYTAEEDGRFEFTSLSPGQYQLDVESSDFSHSGEIVEVSPEKANYHSINISN